MGVSILLWLNACCFVAQVLATGKPVPDNAAVCRHLMESINKKNKNAKVKEFVVRNHMWVFVNCQIVNPAFDSQVLCQYHWMLYIMMAWGLRTATLQRVLYM